MTTEEKQKKSDLLQGWIRTIWPIIMTAAIILMGYTNLNARVGVLENTVLQMQECIANLDVGQNETNITLGIIQANMENMDTNLTRIVNILDEDR
jgi:hypothetical protein